MDLAQQVEEQRMAEAIQIEEILTEASAYNQRSSVKWYSEMMSEILPDMNKLDIYQSAYWLFVTNEEETL